MKPQSNSLKLGLLDVTGTTHVYHGYIKLNLHQNIQTHEITVTELAMMVKGQQTIIVTTNMLHLMSQHIVGVYPIPASTEPF